MGRILNSLASGHSSVLWGCDRGVLIVSAGLSWSQIPSVKHREHLQGEACLLGCSPESVLLRCRMFCGGGCSGPRLQSASRWAGSGQDNIHGQLVGFALGPKHILCLRERGLRSPWLWV